MTFTPVTAQPASPAPSPAFGMLPHQVSARPFVVMRWLGICGQFLTIVIAHYWLHIALPLPLLLACLTPSVVINLFMMHRFKDKPISHRSVLATLAYDTLQIAVLLYFSGGIQNPFSIFLIAPLAVGASVLPLRQVVVLGAIAMGVAGTLFTFHHPLIWPEPSPVLPDLFTTAQGIAVVVMIILIGFIMWSISHERRKILDAYDEARHMLLKHRALSTIGALTTASIHELGSPLSTIALIAGDMERDIFPDDPLAPDVALLVQESRKCKDILSRLGRHYDDSHSALSGDSDHRAPPRPLPMLLGEIIERLDHQGKMITLDAPSSLRRPSAHLPLFSPQYDLIQVFENILSNAIDHARHTVTLSLVDDPASRHIAITITDDGAGFPESVLSRIGEPYISNRPTASASGSKRGNTSAKPSHHMGLGLFIVSVFLDRIGGKAAFSNLPNHGLNHGGACVHITLPYPENTPSRT